MQLQERFCLILPTLNEADNIVPQIQEVLKSLPQIGQIFVVDDDSSDGTLQQIHNKLKAEVDQGRIRILHRKTNLGLTASLREAIHDTSFDYIGWMDCDLSMPTPLLNDMLTEVGNRVDICVGSRFLDGGEQKSWREAKQDSRIEIFLSTVLNKTLRTFLKLPITDFTSGFVVSKKTTLDKIEWRGKHGEYFLDFIYQANKQGAKISELAYSCGNRIHGYSKTSGTIGLLIKNSYRYLLSVLRVIARNLFTERKPS